MLLILFAGIAFAQTSNLQIMDFNVSPESILNKDTTVSSTMNRLIIRFKCSDFSNAASAYLLFGSSPDSSDVSTVPINISATNNSYKLSLNGKDFPLENRWEGRVDVLIAKLDYQRVYYITLYLMDKTGATTNHVNRRVKQ